MNKKIIACAFSIICLTGIFAFGQRNQFVPNIFNAKNEPFVLEMLNRQPQYQTLEVTEDMAYQQLFRLILSFEKQADKQMNEGHVQRADFLRSFLQRKAGLTSEQANALKVDAQNFETNFGCLANRNTTSQKQSYNSEKLNNDRKQALDEYRRRFRRLFGENGFNKFDKFIREEIASRIIYSQDLQTQSAFFGMSTIDYYDNEVVGYSSTSMPPGHCQTITNMVQAILSSDAEGVIDADAAEVCDGEAEVYLYFSNPQPQDEVCIDGEHQYATTFIPWITDTMSGRLNKSSRRSNAGYCYYEKAENLPPSESCLTTPPLPNVTSVNFQLIQQGNTGIDTNPNVGGGRRIFPDDDSPGENVNRQQIRVTARLSENQAGVRVYFGNFDLDDPSDDPIIDPYGTAADDNDGDVGGNTAGQLSATYADTNSNGEASVNFTVTRQPGDNFAIAAGTNQGQVGNVTVSGTDLINGNGASIDVNCDGTDAVCRSEMLTVWRRLHMEVDSMHESDGNYVVGNFAQTTRVGVTEVDVPVNTSQPLDVNRFEGGRLVSGSRSFLVTGNTTNTVRIRVMLGGTVRVNQGETFQLYDDDDFDDDGGLLNGDTGEDIPEPPDSLLQPNDTVCSQDVQTNCNVFASSYIRPLRYTATDTHDNSIFQANILGTTPDDFRIIYVDFDQRATQADQEFWTIYLYGTYQRLLTSDADPADEDGDGNPDGCPDASYGTTDANGPLGWGSTVHMEVGRPREYPNNYISRPVSRAWTAAHELGHLFGGIHDDGGIMTPSCTRTGYEFAPVTIRRLREIMNP
jgi:hypothetical protein